MVTRKLKNRDDNVDFLRKTLLIVPFIVLLTLSSVSGPLKASESSTPNKILEATEPAFRKWLANIPDHRITDYGFHSQQEMNNAKLLMPIPALFPVRGTKALTKLSVEETTWAMQRKWIAPVTVGERIVCMVVVNHEEGKEPIAAEFGKTYAANRLDAGYRLLGWPRKSTITEMRLISFFSPVYEILLGKDANKGWIWVNLTGTTNADAQIMSKEDIHRILENLNKTIPLPIYGSEEPN